MNLELDNSKIIGVYASGNYGKSFLIRYIIEQINDYTPVFIYDTNQEKLSNYKGLKNTFFITPQKLINLEDPEVLEKSILKLRSEYSNFFLVIEDIDKFFTEQKKANIISKLSSDNRHQRIGVIYATKYPTQIPPRLRGNTHIFFFGQFVEPLYVKTINEIIPKSLIKKIKKPEFIMFNRSTNEKFKVVIDNGELKGELLNE